MQSIGSLCYRKMSLNQALQASECKQLSPQQLSRFLFSDDFNRRRDVAMSITVSISAVQSHRPNVDADETSNNGRSPSLISISVGADNPCCQKPHGSPGSFSLTGTIFLSIPRYFARIQSSRSQYFRSTNHLSYGFHFNFLLKACFKSLHAIRPLIGSTAVTSTSRHSY